MTEINNTCGYLELKNWTIVFDLDGTLIDTAPDVCGALNRTLAKLGRRPHSVEEVHEYMGRGARITVERALKATGSVLSSDDMDRITKDFLEDYAQNPVQDSQVFPHVMDTLRHFKDGGAHLAICTNKPTITTRPVLSVFDLDSTFDAVICGDQTPHSKPKGSHILETIDAAKGNHEHAIMIGDSENDIFAAIDAGVPSILVTFGYCHQPIEELKADVVVDCYSEIPGAVDRIIETNSRNTLTN